MKTEMTLLVVEDSENHLADVKAMLERELPLLPLKLEVMYASTLEEAEKLLGQADIVMTDVFFPAQAGGDAEVPNGKEVVQQCLDANRPVVWVTSTYHHGTKTNEVSEWGRQRGLEMFDCDPMRDQNVSYNDFMKNGEGQHKPWREALLCLFYAVVARENGDPNAKPPRGKHWVPENEKMKESHTSVVWQTMLEMGFRIFQK